ncbi:hypothetical protein [Thermodesulfovibrio hydrogeniphilus]
MKVKFVITLDSKKHADIINIFEKIDAELRKHVIVAGVRLLLQNPENFLSTLIHDESNSEKGETLQKEKIRSQASIKKDKLESFTKGEESQNPYKIDFGSIF